MVIHRSHFITITLRIIALGSILIIKIQSLHHINFSNIFKRYNKIYSKNKYFNKVHHHYLPQHYYSMSSIISLDSVNVVNNAAITTTGNNINELIFNNTNLNNLPTDKNKSKISRQVSNSIFSLIDPTPVQSPELIIKSSKALDLLHLSSLVSDDILSQYFSGNLIIPGSIPAAHCYCGHQFGNFAGQLGDGATMYLGEIINPTNGVKWELQLKGAGKTAFSRQADGRKVLRSSVREFLCSEAMNALNIPTTRAGTCITSSSTVVRDPFYDGRSINEKCTVISRIASNFFRFGSFEIFKKSNSRMDRNGPSAGNEELKKQLLDHIITYFPHLTSTTSTSAGKSDDTTINTSIVYQEFFKEVISKTAELVALWQSVGFTHGVLNTDNMSIMGLTIDYGPFGFLEYYDNNYIPNGSDNSGRYSYEKQPEICKWNLIKLSEVLTPLLEFNISAELIKEYDNIYQQKYDHILFQKFGFIESKSLSTTSSTVASTSASYTNSGVNALSNCNDFTRDKQVINEFYDIMAKTFCDYTDTFVALTMFIEELSSSSSSSQVMVDTLIQRLLSRCASPNTMISILQRKLKIYRLSMQPKEIEKLQLMLKTLPKKDIEEIFNGASYDSIYEEITNEKNKLDIIQQISIDIKKYEKMNLEVKREHDRLLWSSWCHKYYNRVHNPQSTATSTSTPTLINNQQRLSVMMANNPTIILRNWLAQDVIEKAEKNHDYVAVQVLFDMLQDPYNIKYRTFKSSGDGISLSSSSSSSCSLNKIYTDLSVDEKKDYLLQLYSSSPPEWADGLICTCSS